jgi:hypothetical protein
MQNGRVEQTIRFATEEDAKLIYALELSFTSTEISARYQPQEVTVIIPTKEAHSWSLSEQVGLYCDFHVGGGVLALLVEKDFACLDGTDVENEDTFPNPNREIPC